MPLVNPMMTGRGMKRTDAPRPVNPITTSMMPAMSVTRARPGMPKRATMPATMTTNAPVGPPICVREPPSAEIRKPATTAVYKPACGVTPEAIPKAIARGSATSPTVMPASRSCRNAFALYVLRARTDFGRFGLLKDMGDHLYFTFKATAGARFCNHGLSPSNQD